MKKLFLIWLLFVVTVLLIYLIQTNMSSHKQTKQSESFPVAVVRKAHFKFEPVVEGTIVRHEYSIENKGSAPLTIDRVKTGCGCTAAEHTRTIDAGSHGTIAIKGNTSGYGGRTFTKTIKVYTNDIHHQVLTLFFSGDVESFARIQPARVFLKGNAGDTFESVVTITILDKYPFRITGSSTKHLNNKISFDVKKVNNSYILNVINLQRKPGNYSGTIHLKTDSSVKSDITVNVYGMIKEKQ
jgi:hypothetical protein